MSSLVTPLLVGAALALVALVYVLLPVLGIRRPGALVDREHGPRFASPASERSADVGPSAVDTLREIEFDRETGKLSNADYLALRKTYTERALGELRAEPAGAGTPIAPPATMARAPLVCPTCGPRTESDALYCSTCARYLAGACRACGAAVPEPAARFCPGCGQRLAA